MGKSDWHQAEELFHQLREMAELDRDTALEATARKDPDLAQQVRLLLVEHDQGQEFLSRPAFEELPHSRWTLPENWNSSPPHFGPYRLTRLIGSGGMGVVYEATHEETEERVALKALRSGLLADDRQRQLFQREVRCLSLLQHPGIPRMLDSGESAEGLTYFVMEFVRGRPLDEFVRDQGLSRRERLQLFSKLCDIIRYAHGKGVLHRDLKPANVLVTSSQHSENAPELKVLDFGLARRASESAPHTSRLTKTGQVFGTLSAMSPEQARGDSKSIGPATDVYSLGVILYGLITDREPYDLTPLPLPRALEVVCELEPPRPSLHDPLLRGDLDVLTLKALEKDPAHRFPSVAELQAEVDRFLSGEPIRTRPPSRRRLLRQAIVRHRLIAGFTIATLVLCTVASGWLWVLYSRAQRAEAAARVDAHSARQVARILEDLISSADPTQSEGPDLLVRDVLEEAETWLPAEAEDQPEVEAALRLVMGRAYTNLRLFDKAEFQTRIGIDCLQRAGGNNRRLGSAKILLGEILLHRQQVSEARQIVQEVLRSPELSPLNEHNHARAVRTMGSIHEESGELEAAEAKYRTALEWYRAHRHRLIGEFVEMLGTLAGLRERRGDFREAATLLQEAMDAVSQSETKNSLYVASIRRRVALLRHRLGQHTEAESLIRRILATDEARLGPRHAQTLMDRDLLAAILRGQQKHREATAILREVLQAYEETNPQSSLRFESQTNLAVILFETGRLAEAEALLHEILAHRLAHNGEGHLRTRTTWMLLGEVQLRQHRPADAVDSHLRAIEINDQLFGEDHFEGGMMHASLAHAYYLLEDFVLAEDHADESWRRLKDSVPETHPHAVTCLNLLAQLSLEDHRFDDAVDYYRELLRRIEASPEIPSGRIHEMRLKLADALIRGDRWSEADEILGKSEAWLQQNHPAHHPSVRLATELRQSITHTVANLNTRE